MQADADLHGESAIWQFDMKKEKMRRAECPKWNGYSMPHDTMLSLSVQVMQHKVTCGSLGHSEQQVVLNMEVCITSNSGPSDPLLFPDLDW